MKRTIGINGKYRTLVIDKKGGNKKHPTADNTLPRTILDHVETILLSRVKIAA